MVTKSFALIAVFSPLHKSRMAFVCC